MAVRRNPAPRNKAVQMRVVHQVLPPGVQHGQETDLRAEVFWVGRDDAQGLRHGAEENIVDQWLVLERDGGDLVRDREHHMEVWCVEQLRLAVLQPLSSCETLAFWTVPVTARVVGDAPMPTAVATLDVTAQCRGTALFDRSHRMAPRGGQRRAVAVAISLAVAAEDIRHLGSLARHRPPLRRARRPAGRAANNSAHPAGWRWRRPCWWRSEDTARWCTDCCDPAEAGWYAGRCRPPADAPRKRDAGNAA